MNFSIVQSYCHFYYWAWALLGNMSWNWLLILAVFQTCVKKLLKLRTSCFKTLKPSLLYYAAFLAGLLACLEECTEKSKTTYKTSQISTLSPSTMIKISKFRPEIVRPFSYCLYGIWFNSAIKVHCKFERLLKTSIFANILSF